MLEFLTAVAMLTAHLDPAEGHSPSTEAMKSRIHAPTPTDQYQSVQLRGWTVRVNPAIESESPELLAATIEELDKQLYAITRVIPPTALQRIRQIDIWVELEMPKTACMCYHVSREWLIPNGYNGDKEGDVEIGNARAFLEWTKGQPWMVLHELAHGYHDQVFGYEDPEIKRAWKRVEESGIYDSVSHISGKPRKHYALTNQMEWFAESTEALYGTNDFYPYVRSELFEADPDGGALVKQLWELSPLPTQNDQIMKQDDPID
ncbi:MAG: hypothetical protein MK100_05255 [Phycisphaerales bacterium]|nr:hypothetical protein [Phycisphaerales bacterium]